MDTIWIGAASALLLLGVLFRTLKRQGGATWKWGSRFERLDSVVGNAEDSSVAYFRSLELMLKNLETVRSRTEHAEQRLWEIVARPNLERENRYEAAELLLAQGQKPARVAALLNLPISEVKAVRGPQNEAGGVRRKAGQKIAGAKSDSAHGRHDGGDLLKRAKKTAVLHDDETMNGAVGPLVRERRAPRHNGVSE